MTATGGWKERRNGGIMGMENEREEYRVVGKKERCGSGGERE